MKRGGGGKKKKPQKKRGGHTKGQLAVRRPVARKANSRKKNLMSVNTIAHTGTPVDPAIM